MSKTEKDLRILRYEFNVNKYMEIVDIPEKFALLSAHPGRQQTIGKYTIDIWVMADVNSKSKPQKFYIIGTGHEIPETVLQFIGTCVMDDGYVWHAFIEMQGEEGN